MLSFFHITIQTGAVVIVIVWLLDLQLPMQSMSIATILWVRCVLDTTLCDEVCQWLAAGLLFSPSIPISSTNKTDRHDITDILLKVVVNTINQATNHTSIMYLKTRCIDGIYLGWWAFHVTFNNLSAVSRRSVVSSIPCHCQNRTHNF
jgi:hypothetical protein